MINLKLHETLNKIINENNNISSYLYKLLFELIKKNNDDNDRDIDNISTESFMTLYYKLYKENIENLKEINKIINYFIVDKKIFLIKENVLQEIKLQINDILLKNLLDYSLNTLIVLIKNLQIDDQNFSQNFNLYEIQKLYTYCLKGKDSNSIKERQINLMKLIIGILEINDEFIFDRIKILLGYPTLVIQKDVKKNISLFGVSLMNNDINKEIFKYISYNNIKKERCILAFLFPSSYEKNEENHLDENDRNDLMYELIKSCMGINEANEGNYILFKNLYLMQSRSIKYDNLYKEMKEILENANKKNNNKYDFSKIKEEEQKCIKLIEYEIRNLNNKINISRTNPSSNSLKEEEESNNLGAKPKLSDLFKSSERLIDNKLNINFNGVINDIIPHEIGKIEITLLASKENLNIFRFEYFTTYFTKKELLQLSDEKKEFNKNEEISVSNDKDDEFFEIDF